jgi:hypothetical protein
VNNNAGRGRRPEAAALDPNTECYAIGECQAVERACAKRPGDSPLDPNTECYAIGECQAVERACAKRPGDSPLAELVGLVQAVRLLEERISQCVAACHEEGCRATAVARVLGRHRTSVYRLPSWRQVSVEEATGPTAQGPRTGPVTCTLTLGSCGPVSRSDKR